MYKYFFFSLLLLSLSCSKHQANLPPADLSAVDRSFLTLTKAELSKQMIAMVKEANLALNTRKVSDDKRKTFSDFCRRLYIDFVNNEVNIIEPAYVASDRAALSGYLPNHLRDTIKVEDFYVVHKGERVKYSSPQPPFEFYALDFSGKTYQFLYSWFSQLNDKKRRYDSKGQYVIYSSSLDRPNKYDVHYSSNGALPDFSVSEGFHVLFKHSNSLYLANVRRYFDTDIASDYLSFKQFDRDEGQFNEACDFFGGHLAR